MEQTGGVFVEQVIRPTGLIDPPVEIRPVSGQTRNQVDDVIDEVKAVARAGYRSLVTVLTKKMAEDLTEYMHEQGVRVRYMHSDVDTLERIEIIRDLRLGTFDVLIGINLLREGLDIPECGLVAILDADKEGFLRSETSLIQTIGRAARNVDGRVILYADRITGSMERAIAETEPPPRTPGGLQRRTRHHARERQARHQGDPEQPLREGPRPDPHGREGGQPNPSSAPISRPPSRTWKAACARPPPTSSSRRPRRLRDEIKKMKLLDLEFANDLMTAEGQEVDKAAPKQWRAEAAAEKAEAFRKGRLQRQTELSTANL